VRLAIVREPEYVAGSERFDTDLIRVGNGRIVGKVGAEGVHATALLDGGIGLVLKVVDGAQRAVAPAAMALLNRLGVLDEGQRAALQRHARAVVPNAAGTIVGDVTALDFVAG